MSDTKKHFFIEIEQGDNGFILEIKDIKAYKSTKTIHNTSTSLMSALDLAVNHIGSQIYLPSELPKDEPTTWHEVPT